MPYTGYITQRPLRETLLGSGQREMFIELTADERTVVAILKTEDAVQIDALYARAGLTSSSIAAALLMLEMQGVVASLPGKVYKLT